MSRWGKLIPLVRVGGFFMLLGNALTATLAFSDSSWKYFAYIFPANFGQGMIYPSILFTSLASFDHAGKLLLGMLCLLSSDLLDHAVTASTVYLVRSLGTVWGVSISSAILQTTLSVRLPEALGDVPNKWKVRPLHNPSSYMLSMVRHHILIQSLTYGVFLPDLSRSLTTSDTLWRRCVRSLLRFSSRYSMSTMTVSAMPLLPLPRPLHLSSWPRFWPAPAVCARLTSCMPAPFTSQHKLRPREYGLKYRVGNYRMKLIFALDYTSILQWPRISRPTHRAHSLMSYFGPAHLYISPQASSYQPLQNESRSDTRAYKVHTRCAGV